VEPVAVTGLGIVSALGANRIEFWGAAVAGRTGIAPMSIVDASDLRFKMAAEVRAYDPAAAFHDRQLELMDRFAQFAVVAARESVADAGITWTPELRDRTAIVTGSCLGGQTSEDNSFADLYLRNRGRVHPLTIPRTMANAGASHIAAEFGVTGPTFTLSTACASASHAIGMALALIRSGVVDMAIAGGSEAPFSPGILKAWDSLRVVSPDICRPFSVDRRGMILGEGGAMLVLENLAVARARGARIWAELVGFGASSDAAHITQPCATGAGRAMQRALHDARIAPEAVGYINAHGTGTATNDRVETAAIRATFGVHADNLAVSSTKAMHGHALGAAGAIEAVATVLALAEGVLPPTISYSAFDPECALDVVPNEARVTPIQCALSNSFAFGGLNAVLAFRRSAQ